MNFKEKQMTNKKWALLLITVSIPLLWYGLNQFIYGGGHDTLGAILVSVSLTAGLTMFCGGLYLLFTKDRGVVLASQTTVGDPPIQNPIKKPTKKVNEMAKVKTTKDTHVADSVKEFREIGQSMKDGATRRANIRARLKEMGIAIDEDGKIDV